jgi:hypothetical protein
VRRTILCVLLAGCASDAGSLPLENPAALLSPPTRQSDWSVVASPNAPPGTDGLYDDQLNGVSGTGPNDVWAVGDDCCYTQGSQEYYHALILHWNGSKWSVVPFAKDEPADTYLHAVSAISPNDAWTVGNAPYPNNQAVAEHWNGKKWSAVPTPYIYNNGELLSVVAISSNNVWAAGEGNFSAILEHWNGTSWSFVRAYTYGLTILTSIAATGPNDIMAIGSYYSISSFLFAEHWNGSEWTYEPPVNSFYNAGFYGLTAVSRDRYWAVGYGEPSRAQQEPQTVTEYWNGSWKLVPSPNKKPKGSYNTQQHALRRGSRIGEGRLGGRSLDVYPGAGTFRSLFERWNGKAWKVQPGPPSLESSNNSAENELLNLTKLPSGQLWGVGNQTISPNCCSETLTVQANPMLQSR